MDIYDWNIAFLVNIRKDDSFFMTWLSYAPFNQK